MSYQTQWDGRSGYGGKRHRWGWKVLAAALALLIALFAALEVWIGAKSRGHPPEAGDAMEVMVIFGCKVMPWGPSVLLQDRLDTALRYLDDHPDLPVVVTGGKGDDEHLSEAQCMSDYLRSRGFEGTILMEDRSVNTWENVCYTLDLLEENGYGTAGNILAVSNGFHLGRIGMLLGRAGVSAGRVYSLSAPSSHRPSAVRMFFREPLALVKSFVTDR